MTADRASRVAARCLAFAFAAAFAMEAAAQAGTVRSLEGLAYVRTVTAARIALKPGSSIAVGSSIVAGPDAAIELELADGQVLGLGSETNARIDRFRFDSGNPAASQLDIALVEGAMRFVGGTIVRTRPQAARAAGAGAQVSVLGGDQVDFTLVVESAALKSGALHVTSGQVVLTAPSGAQQVLSSGQSARWKGEGEATVMPLSAMPAELAARINSVAASASSSPL